MNTIKNNNSGQCGLCSDLIEHSHLVRTYMKFEGSSDVTRIVGYVCCKCVTRLANRQVPSPYKDEAGQNALKESAPIPFTPQIDWGAIEEMMRLKELTRQKQAAKASTAQRTPQKKAWW